MKWRYGGGKNEGWRCGVTGKERSDGAETAAAGEEGDKGERAIDIKGVGGEVEGYIINRGEGEVISHEELEEKW